MTREQVAVKGIPRDQLRGFPDIGQDELIRFFTLTPADVEFVASRRARGPAQGLGLAVQLCTLPWLGFVPDEVRAAPPVAVQPSPRPARTPATATCTVGQPSPSPAQGLLRGAKQRTRHPRAST